MMRIQDTHTTFRTSVPLVSLALVAVLFLPATSRAATVTGLTLSDGTTNVTVVEADAFTSGGTAGNTVLTATGGFYNEGNDLDDGYWWNRTLDPSPPISAAAAWTALGGTDRRHELKTGEAAGGNPAGDLPLNLQSADITLSVGGLSASDAHDIFLIVTGRESEQGGAATFLADLDAIATTPHSLAAANPFVVGAGSTGENAGSNFEVFALAVGQIAAGDTDFDLHINGGGTGDIRIIGAGYVAAPAQDDIPEPCTLVLASLAVAGLGGVRPEAPARDVLSKPENNENVRLFSTENGA